jgi:hypothetical protein
MSLPGTTLRIGKQIVYMRHFNRHIQYTDDLRFSEVNGPKSKPRKNHRPIRGPNIFFNDDRITEPSTTRSLLLRE